MTTSEAPEFNHTPADLIEQVLDFHLKFVREKIARRAIEPAIGSDELQFRLDFLDEEFTELKEALAKGDRAAELDAYVDICWVAIGSALMRFGSAAFDSACNEVARANMAKVRVPGNFKIQKPAGWTPPRIDEVIDIHSEAVEVDVRGA